MKKIKTLIQKRLIRYQQGKALKRVDKLLLNKKYSDPNLTGEIWHLINDANSKIKINDELAEKLADNWQQDMVGVLQRKLVDYQLYQMKHNNSPMVIHLINEIMKQFKEINNLSILDIGCSTGYYSEVFKFYDPEKFKYNGCDYNQESIKIAQSKYPDLDFYCEDATRMSFSDNKFDICFMSGAI